MKLTSHFACALILCISSFGCAATTSTTPDENAMAKVSSTPPSQTVANPGESKDAGNKVVISDHNSTVEIKTSGTDQTASVKADSDGSSVALGSGKQTVVATNKQRRTINCQGGEVVVNGNDNVLTLSGECSNLSVNGNGNTIRAEAVGSIVTSGNDNKVTWEKGVGGGKKPQVSNPGSRNTITQAQG